MRIMIIGAGDIGMPLIQYLSKRSHLLTVIEVNEERCKEITHHSDAAIFCGNGGDLEIWKYTEADKMDVLLALTNNDEANIEICKIAKKQFGIPFVVARSHQPKNMISMKNSGADIVICPAQETRRLFLNAVESLTAETLYEDILADFKIVKVTIPANGSIIGKTVDHLGISENCRISGVLRGGMLVFPSKSFVFKGGDKVLLSGSLKFVENMVDRCRMVELT